MESDLTTTVAMCAKSSVEGELFWFRCSVIVHVFTPAEELRVWGGGCECHEVDRMDGRKVDCELAGRRMRQAWFRIQEFLCRDRVPESGTLTDLSREQVAELVRAEAMLKGTVH